MLENILKIVQLLISVAPAEIAIIKSIVDALHAAHVAAGTLTPTTTTTTIVTKAPGA